MNVIRDIQSLSVFKQNASKMIKEIQQTKAPLILTVNGKAAVVVQDAESYQKLLDATEYNETLAILRRRHRAVEDGIEMRSAEEFFAEFSRKYGVSFEDAQYRNTKR